jgi:hypothetical protein
MYSKKIIIALGTCLLIVVIASCSRNVESPGERKSVTAELSGEVLDCKSFVGGYLLNAYKDCLIFDTYDNSAKIAIYRIDGDSLVLADKGIKKGRGPYEVIYANYCQSGDSLFVLDSNPMGFNTIYGIPLNEAGALSDYGQWKKYPCDGIPQMITAGYFVKIGSGRFVVNAAEPGTEHIFSILDYTDRSVTQLEYWPEDGNECETEVKQMAYINNWISGGVGDRVVYAAGKGRYMAIMRPEDGVMKEKSMIYDVFPKFTSKNYNIKYEMDQYKGIFVTSSAKRIYAKLYQDDWGESEEYKGYSPHFFDEIEIYDWNGRFIKCIRTDRPYSSFCPSPDDKYIYTTSIDLETGEDLILRYRVK